MGNKSPLNSFLLSRAVRAWFDDCSNKMRDYNSKSKVESPKSNVQCPMSNIESLAFTVGDC